MEPFKTLSNAMNAFDALPMWSQTLILFGSLILVSTACMVWVMVNKKQEEF